MCELQSQNSSGMERIPMVDKCPEILKNDSSSLSGDSSVVAAF